MEHSEVMRPDGYQDCTMVVSVYSSIGTPASPTAVDRTCKIHIDSYHRKADKPLLTPPKSYKCMDEDAASGMDTTYNRIRHVNLGTTSNAHFG